MNLKPRRAFLSDRRLQALETTHVVHQHRTERERLSLDQVQAGTEFG